MKPVDGKSSTYIDFNRDNKKEPFFEKGYFPNRSEEVFVIKKLGKAVPWTSIVRYFNGEEVFRTFYKKKLQKNKSKGLEFKK